MSSRRLYGRYRTLNLAQSILLRYQATSHLISRSSILIRSTVRSAWSITVEYIRCARATQVHGSCRSGPCLRAPHRYTVVVAVVPFCRRRSLFDRVLDADYAELRKIVKVRTPVALELARIGWSFNQWSVTLHVAKKFKLIVQVHYVIT